LIFSAGVLYHMRDPIGLIAKLARHTNRLYMWTHYYDDALQQNPHLKDRYKVHTPAITEGFHYTLHRQEYMHSLAVAGFCGGSSDFSHWISRTDLLNALAHFGFGDVRIAHEQTDHPHGPCFDIVAIK
jgi:hypothetical protein